MWYLWSNSNKFVEYFEIMAAFEIGLNYYGKPASLNLEKQFTTKTLISKTTQMLNVGC